MFVVSCDEEFSGSQRQAKAYRTCLSFRATKTSAGVSDKLKHIAHVVVSCDEDFCGSQRQAKAYRTCLSFRATKNSAGVSDKLKHIGHVCRFVRRRLLRESATS